MTSEVNRFEKVTYFDFYEFEMHQEKLRRSFVALFNLFHGLCSHAVSLKMQNLSNLDQKTGAKNYLEISC